MRRAILLSVALVFAVPAPALADHQGDRYDQRDGCGEQGGGCGNERDEDYSGAGCKYACPTFDKSPVQDSFNIQICVQPGSCSSKDDKKGGGQERQPAALACLVPVPWHCDTKPEGA